jgi:sulfate permease, SulP family
VPQERRAGSVVATISAGLVIGIVEVVLAISFAALVFGGYIENFLPNGIGIYLVAAALTLGILALRSGSRGVVGSVQDAAAAVLAIVAADAALDATGSTNRAFLTVVAATIVVTLLTAMTFLLIGRFRLGNLARFIPYPVVGGFLAGTGWLLLKGGLRVAAGIELQVGAISHFLDPFELARWVPALGFGVILLLATRFVRRPLVIPAVLAFGLVAFAVGMLVTGSSIQDARDGLWMLGPFPPGGLWEEFWTVRALGGADWSAVLDQVPGIATAVFVAVMACVFNVGGVELLLHTDLDSNQQLRDAGLVNVANGIVGGIPGYHALSLTALATQMSVDGRGAGLIAAPIPLAVVIFGAAMVELVPRMIVGGVLVFVGLSFLVAWLVDVRKSLPGGECLVVVAVVGTLATRGLVPGLVVGLVLAVVMFAVNYGRIDVVREIAFGTTYRSNVDRPPGERAALHGLSDRVQVLRLTGFVFFGTASGLLERIRKRVETGEVLFLLLDVRRVTGMDSSGVVAMGKVAQLAEASGFVLVFAGASDRVRTQLARGGVAASEGVVRFEPDLDRGLQWCEDRLLEGVARVAAGAGDGLATLPPHLRPYLEPRSVDAGTVLIRQGDPSDALFVLESGRLSVEMSTPEGTRMRLGTVRPGAMVGEMALYTGVSRTADVVAETPSVVLELSRAAMDRLEADEPETAAALHRWLATTLAERLTDSLRAYATLLD